MLYLLAMPVVRLPGFLCEAEQQELHALAEYTRATAPEVWATDALGLVEEEEWRTTFLNQRLPDLLPQLWERVLGAIGDPNPNPNPNPNPYPNPNPNPNRVLGAIGEADPNPTPNPTPNPSSNRDRRNR